MTDPEREIALEPTDRERLDQQTQRLLEAHQTVAQTLSNLKETIDRRIAQDPDSQPDPAGWRIYVYSPDQVTAEQLNNIPTSIAEAFSAPPLPTAQWEIDFYAGGRNAKGDSLPQDFSILAEAAPAYSLKRPVHMELFPIGVSSPEWTRLTIDLPDLRTRPSVTSQRTSPAIYSEVDHRQPKYHDPGRRSDVLLLGVSTRDAQAAGLYAEATASELKQFMQELESGRFYMRVFGNSAGSPMKPQVFVPHSQLPPKS